MSRRSASVQKAILQPQSLCEIHVSVICESLSPVLIQGATLPVTGCDNGHMRKMFPPRSYVWQFDLFVESIECIHPLFLLIPGESNTFVI